MTYEQIHVTAAFKLLAQGMKDREAFTIVLALHVAELYMPLDAPSVVGLFERWAESELEEQDKEVT